MNGVTFTPSSTSNSSSTGGTSSNPTASSAATATGVGENSGTQVSTIYTCKWHIEGRFILKSTAVNNARKYIWSRSHWPFQDIITISSDDCAHRSRFIDHIPWWNRPRRKDTIIKIHILTRRPWQSLKPNYPRYHCFLTISHSVVMIPETALSFTLD